MKCSECEETTTELYVDPRTPPLEEEPCLCGDCYLDAARGVVDALRDQVTYLEFDMMCVRRDSENEN